MLSRVFYSASLAACLAAGLGCGSPQTRVDRDRRVVQARSVGRDVTYRFGPVPLGWREIEIEGNDAAWHDADSGGVVHVDHSCERAQDTPLASLVQHLLIGFTDREFASEETVPFDGREARHVVVRARLDGVPVVLELYVMKKDGCVYDIGLVAPPETFARVSADFNGFARGFHTITTGSAEEAAESSGPAEASR